MGEMAYHTEGKQSFMLLSEFDEQLSRLDGLLDELTASLNPILETQGPDVAGMAPEEAPYHDLHNSILRLRRLNNRLDSVRRRVKL